MLCDTRVDKFIGDFAGVDFAFAVMALEARRERRTNADSDSFRSKTFPATCISMLRPNYLIRPYVEGGVP